jgi:hypothetical protein
MGVPRCASTSARPPAGTSRGPGGLMKQGWPYGLHELSVIS